MNVSDSREIANPFECATLQVTSMEVAMKQTKNRNPVAKYARQFNKSSVQADRKKASKAGYQKHKGQCHSQAA